MSDSRSKFGFFAKLPFFKKNIKLTADDIQKLISAIQKFQQTAHEILLFGAGLHLIYDLRDIQALPYQNQCEQMLRALHRERAKFLALDRLPPRDVQQFTLLLEFLEYCVRHPEQIATINIPLEGHSTGYAIDPFNHPLADIPVWRPESAAAADATPTEESLADRFNRALEVLEKKDPPMKDYFITAAQKDRLVDPLTLDIIKDPIAFIRQERPRLICFMERESYEQIKFRNPEEKFIDPETRQEIPLNKIFLDPKSKPVKAAKSKINQLISEAEACAAQYSAAAAPTSSRKRKNK